jgi:tetratricopeptide (TPR) repeat protein
MATKTGTNYLEERLGANPDSLIFSRLADYYLTRNQLDRAIDTCMRGIAVHPHSMTGRIVLGRCYLKQERWVEAAGTFTEVCRLDPRNPVAIKLLGDILAQRGKTASAGDFYRLVAAMDPFDAKMAGVVARTIGSGKRDLFELLAEAEKNLAEPLKAETIGAGEPSSASEVLETVGESFIDHADAGMEALETMEVTESGPECSALIEEPAAGTGPETPTPQAEELLVDVTGDVESEVMIIPDGPEPPPPAPEIVKSSDSGRSAEIATAAPSAGDTVMPDGSEISSRLDTLFGNEKPALSTPIAPVIDDPEEEMTMGAESGGSVSADGAAEILIVDEITETSRKGRGAELAADEELFIDSRDELLIEDRGDDGIRLAASPEREHEAGTEQLFIDEPPPPPALRQERSASGDAGFGGIDIATPTLAEIYFKQGQLQRALSMYKRLLEKDPGNGRLKLSIDAVTAAIASGKEGVPMEDQERGKASRKIIEETGNDSPAVTREAPDPAADAKSKGSGKFKWIKKPDDR